jgi:protease I
MSTVALVIAAKIFRDEEYLVPKAILEKHHIKVVTVSTTTGWAEGKLGARVKPDQLLAETDPNSLDALAFVGGGGAAQYFDDPVAHRLAREMVKAGKPLAAICCAPVILANAGLLQGKKATVWKDDAPEIIRMGAEYTGAIIEQDGLILTGNGPEAAEAFGNALAEMVLR